MIVVSQTKSSNADKNVLSTKLLYKDYYWSKLVRNNFKKTNIL